MEQKRAERDLEREQACLRQQYTESEYRKHTELCLNVGFRKVDLKYYIMLFSKELKK